MSEIPERADFGSFIPEGRRALWGIGEYVSNTAISRVTTVEQAQAAAGEILANFERDGVTGVGWYIPGGQVLPCVQADAQQAADDRGVTYDDILRLERSYDPSSPYYTPEPEPTTDILDSIDNALGCQRCGRPLSASPSDDFCSSGCLRAWHAQHALPLDPNSPDAARVYVGQDARAVPLDEGVPVTIEHSRDDGSDHTDIVGDPWRPYDTPAGVDWQQLGQYVLGPFGTRVQVYRRDDGPDHRITGERQ